MAKKYPLDLLPPAIPAQPLLRSYLYKRKKTNFSLATIVQICPHRPSLPYNDQSPPSHISLFLISPPTPISMNIHQSTLHRDLSIHAEIILSARTSWAPKSPSLISYHSPHTVKARAVSEPYTLVRIASSIKVRFFISLKGGKKK